jgi:ribosomal protein S18 acetylase RimI-like enzyme
MKIRTSEASDKEEVEMSKEDFLIRDFRKSDLDDLLNLLPKCFSKEFEISGFDADHMRDMINRAYGTTGRLFLASTHLLRKEPIRFLVADVNNKVVGTTMVNSVGKVGYISAVMVSPDYRRKGIATTLVKRGVEYIQGRRMERAVLHVVSTNAPAIGVYSKLGFEAFEQVAHLVGDAATMPPRGEAGEVETRPFRGADLDEVYDLCRASEDPNHLRVFGLSKGQLKMPFWLRMFRYLTEERIVAVRAGKIVGSVLAAYTTPKEAGNISSIQVRPEDRSHGIEKALAESAIDEIRRGGVERIRAMVPTTKPELAETLNSLGFREAMVLVGMFRETR